MCPLLFVPRGTNISYTQERGGDKHFSHTGGRGGDKHFYIEGGNSFTCGVEDKHFYLWGWGGQTFFVEVGGAFDDVDEEMVVSVVNFLVSEASKLSAGARIFRGPEILVSNKFQDETFSLKNYKNSN